MTMIHSTPFPEIGYTHVTGTQVGYTTATGKRGKGRRVDEWSHVDIETGSLVGPRYATRALLVADTARYCIEYGCLPAF